jgi:flagellar biosynthesis GTPase FlhF
MSSNINQATTGSSLVELVKINYDKLTTILFTNTKTPEGKAIKKLFIKISKEYINNDSFFILVDKSNYNDPDHLVEIDNKVNTYFLLFFNMKKISVISGPDIEVCKKNINDVLLKINHAKNNSQPQIQQNQQNQQSQQSQQSQQNQQSQQSQQNQQSQVPQPSMKDEDDDEEDNENKPIKNTDNKTIELTQQQKMQIMNMQQMTKMQKMRKLKMLENYEKSLMVKQMNMINWLEQIARRKKKYEEDHENDD